MTGLPYVWSHTDEDGKPVYQHRRTKEHVKESAIILPDGWNRGVTHAREIFYYNEEHEEYSYVLPGSVDRHLDRDIRELDKNFEDDEPKLTGAQAREHMSKMIDPVDGGLLFCWSKRGTKVGVFQQKSRTWPNRGVIR